MFWDLRGTINSTEWGIWSGRGLEGTSHMSVPLCSLLPCTLVIESKFAWSLSWFLVYLKLLEFLGWYGYFCYLWAPWVILKLMLKDETTQEQDWYPKRPTLWF
jgi:hypothetical protein